MRVGVVTGDFQPEIGGGHVFVASVLEAFISLAGSSPHQFTVFREPGRTADFPAARLPANFKLCALPARGIVGTAIAGAKLHSALARHLLRWPGRIERAALGEGVQLLWFVGGAAYEAPDIPYIATVWDLQHRTHPWFPEVSANGIWEHRELMYERFLRRASRVIAGTRVGADQLGFFYQIPSERVVVLPHPTPSFDFAPDAAPSPAVAKLPSASFFFYPAQFWPHKNHVNLLHALKILGERHGLEAGVALTGSEKGNLAYVAALAGELGLLSRVHFLGFVGARDLVWLYRNAVALVYPSFSGPENLPPLEAFSLGCPVAISDYPGAREQAGDAALYFDPRDPQRLSEVLRELLTRDALRSELSERGRARAARWTARNYATGVLAILDEFEGIRRAWA